MLPYTPEQWKALASHQEGFTSGVATYQGRSVEVRVSEGRITFNGDQEVQASGSVTIAGFGNSLVPKSKTDLLAPFGQELALFRNVRLRSQLFRIPLGVYRIGKASQAFEDIRAGVVLGWSCVVALSDRLQMLANDDFLAVDAPLAGNAVWAEVRRLSRVPVQEALGSASVPPSTVYESRVKAIAALLELLGGVPHMTRQGVLTARTRDAWLTSMTALFDVDGTIDWDDELSGDFFNQVQVKSTNDESVVAYAVIGDDSNPLSVNRAGGRTYKQSAPIYLTTAAAQAAADTILARVSSRRSRLVTVRCTPEVLLLELGDFGWFRDPVQGRAVLGEIRSMTIPMVVTDSVSVQVIVAEEA